MGIANLANIPNDDSGFAAWSFSHMAHHRDITRRIYEVNRVALPEYIIDPVSRDELGSFLYLHQLMHNNQNSVLGIAGFDLLDVDLTDKGQLASWIWLHFQEHYQAGNILGV